ncbi:unnamed protein product [Malus baccata var. baccata]
MGNLLDKEPPPPIVLVPPLFDYPPLGARTRMLESSYDLLFGKLALKCLFDDYFEQARHFSTMIMLKPIDDPHVDLVATVAGPLDHKPEENIIGNAFFRWQSDVDDPHTFMDLFVSNADPVLQMRACAYYPRYGLGAFGIFPMLLKKRITSEDFGVMGLRYGSSNLSVGATVMPFSLKDDCPRRAWLVSKMGRLTAGVQYEPEYGSKDTQKYKNLKNWSAAIGYGVGSSSPLSPSFNFGLELSRSSQFIASFYQHVVVQRRVKNPLEENEVVGITNYIDFGFELQTRVDDIKSSSDIPESSNVPKSSNGPNAPDSTFQVAASWQANKNFMLKVVYLMQSCTCSIGSYQVHERLILYPCRERWALSARRLHWHLNPGGNLLSHSAFQLREITLLGRQVMVLAFAWRILDKPGSFICFLPFLFLFRC